MSLVLQTGTHGAELLLYRTVYFVALMCLASMIVLAFRVHADFHDGVYILLGTTAALCFAFSWGGEHFWWPIPGLVWLVGILFLAFMLGLFIGWLIPFDSNVLVRQPLQRD